MKIQRIMKSIAALLVGAVLIYANSYAADGGVQFTKITSWSQALDMAKKANKPIFLDAYTDWCGWCKVMDNETFSDAGVAAFMNEHFVNVKMEMETGEGIDVAMKYRISSFPTFKVFSVNGMPTNTVFGYQPVKDWMQTLNNMIDPAQVEKAPGITSTLQLSYPEWHRASFLKGKERKMPDAKVVQEWFDKQMDKYNEVAWGIINKYELTEDQQTWVMGHERDYRALYGNEFDNVVNRRAQFIFAKAVNKKDRVLLENAKQLYTTRDPQEAERIHTRLEAMYDERTGDWTALSNLLERMSQQAEESAESVNEHAWKMYEKCEDNASLIKAADAMKRVTQGAAAKWMYVDTYAALLYKIGDDDQAERQALRAIEMGRAEKADVSDTEKLLEKIRSSKRR